MFDSFVAGGDLSLASEKENFRGGKIFFRILINFSDFHSMTFRENGVAARVRGLG
jgi:hypothetical protein